MQIIFKQIRIGKDGIPFVLYKIRNLKIVDNKYIPINRFHSFMRKTGLDELPQLYNIIKGDMRFVGPRPLPPEHTVRIMKVKPGITGLAQLYFGHISTEDMSYIEIHQRARLDKFYEEHHNLLFDIWICFQTIKQMITQKRRLN